MKKAFVALAISVAGTAALAADVSVSGVRDYTLDRDGVRVAATASKPVVRNITPTASVTYINDRYTRYAVGGTIPVAQLGAVAVKATAGGVFQDTAVGANGYGLTAGLQAAVDLSKNVQLTAGVERFVGQSRVNQFNGTVGTVGVALKF